MSGNRTQPADGEAVTIVGIGYVGLPLAVAAAGTGYQTFGLDVSASRIAQVNAGSSPVDTVTVPGPQPLHRALRADNGNSRRPA